MWDFFCTFAAILLLKAMKTSKIVVFFALVLMGLAACQKEKEPVNPFVTPGNTPDPNWTVTVDNDMTKSLTAIVFVAIGEQPGTLAAFMGDECCGIAEYKENLYMLYLSPATEDGGEVQLKFYSPDLKRIFIATDTFLFSNDAILGTPTEPYTPAWKVSE